jgi:hypothetical protein
MEAENRARDAEFFRTARNQGVDRDSIKPATLNKIKIAALAALAGFLVGFVPLWLSSTGYQEELNSVVRTLRPSVLQNELATATINARRGEFEQAREQTSSFFTDLDAELERDESSFAVGQQEAVRSILKQRDDTITLLARRDPASADVLTDLYFSYLQVKNSAVPESK